MATIADLRRLGYDPNGLVHGRIGGRPEDEAIQGGWSDDKPLQLDYGLSRASQGPALSPSQAMRQPAQAKLQDLTQAHNLPPYRRAPQHLDNPIDNPRMEVPEGTGMFRNNTTGTTVRFNRPAVQSNVYSEVPDYSRPGIEIPGVGVGHWAKGDDRVALIGNRRFVFGSQPRNQELEQQAAYDRALLIADKQATIDQKRAATQELQQRISNRSFAAKAPAGWQFDPDGKLSRIPGGPADEKFMAQYYKDDQGVQSSIAAMRNMTELATQALKAPGLSGQFGVQGVFPDFPGGDSANAKVLLERLKNVAGMSALEALKAAGNSGSSGLGAVTEFEHRLLQSQLANLNKAQSLKQAKEEITNLIAKTEAAVKRIEGHHARMYRGVQPPAPENLPPSSPTTPASAQESSFDSLPDPATWPQGKVLRDTRTGQRLQVVNGKWEIQ